MKKVAVYWTLKDWHGNEWAMRMANWKLLSTDYVEVEKLKNVWFPCVKFKSWTNKWLLVEVYEVDKKGIEWPLDWLEGYTPWAENNHYNRIEVKTLKWEEVQVYEIADDVNDQLEDYYTHAEGDKLFYNWK